MWAATVVAATAGALSPATAQVQPTSADFGDSPPGGNDGARREFRLPSRGRGNIDTVTTALSGPGAGEFRVSEKACFEVGPPECLLRVMFVPTSYGRKVATLTVSGPGGPLGTATLTGNAVFGCMPAHVPCNYAGNYSGSVRWTEYLKSSHSGGGVTVNTAEAVVTIRAGVASCEGSRKDSTAAPGLSVSVRVVRIRGEGIAIVEFGPKGTTADGPAGPWYRVTVVCPDAGWTMSTKDLRTGEVQTTSDYPPPQPAEMGQGEVTTYEVADSGQHLLLTGSTSYQHPDADPANNTVGRFTLGWSLSRVDQPPSGPPPTPPAAPPESARDGSGKAPMVRVRLVWRTSSNGR